MLIHHLNHQNIFYNILCVGDDYRKYLFSFSNKNDTRSISKIERTQLLVNVTLGVSVQAMYTVNHNCSTGLMTLISGTPAMPRAEFNDSFFQFISPFSTIIYIAPLIYTMREIQCKKSRILYCGTKIIKNTNLFLYSEECNISTDNIRIFIKRLKLYYI